MKITSETYLRNFQFWGGAVERAAQLTLDEMDELEAAFEDIYPEGMSETLINDIFWFEFEFVAECLGLEYDSEADEIIR